MCVYQCVFFGDSVEPCSPPVSARHGCLALHMQWLCSWLCNPAVAVLTAVPPYSGTALQWPNSPAVAVQPCSGCVLAVQAYSGCVLAVQP